MRIDIPGYKTLDINNIVLDYNGTFARDGAPIMEAISLINNLITEYKVYVLTSDTYGTAKELLKPLKGEVHIVKDTEEKKTFVMGLAGDTACIGNGNNDTGMFEVDDLSICVIGDEGASAAALLKSDIVVKDIISALELFKNPKRIAATLRK
ncbi:HAD family hydrolase [Calorimonas adulescens]|jgi:hypothetical protein|uniref:HAD family hydrolase n=1 Tax=Calorimonas adulescens TaxID=2606906 RepID=A0A5D8Q6E3_9THEO|nr:HAD family hydrolase [Calorimonas adulescens]TZE80260.1 HAD family hydrolase [Calorimonas adulescens]